MTVEANPESFSAELAELLAAAGVTRVSLGVQSFDDSVLRLLGRPHDAAEAARAVRMASGSGADVSIDLMCGVPGQTVTSWQETLDQAVRSGVGHISVYPLSLEEGTPLSVAVDSELVEPPDADLAADMLVFAEDVLAAAGFVHYEIANYARPGHESRHNTAYWTGRQYLGIGPGAHGMLEPATAAAVGFVDSEVDVRAVGRVRYREAADIQAWLVGTHESVELLTPAQAEREDIMLGMRRSVGVRSEAVEAAGLSDVFASLHRARLVESTEGEHPAWRLTRRGRLLGNEVFGAIWNAG